MVAIKSYTCSSWNSVANCLNWSCLNLSASLTDDNLTAVTRNLSSSVLFDVLPIHCKNWGFTKVVKIDIYLQATL